MDSNNPFGNMMQQVQAAQEKLKNIESDLADERVEGESGAGMVKVIGKGDGEILETIIDDSVYQEKKEVLAGLITSAMNDLKKKQARLRQEKLKSMMGDMGLPMNFPFMN